MSDDKKIENDKDHFPGRSGRNISGREHESPFNGESITAIERQVFDDLDDLSGLFKGARPGPGEIPESVDNIIFGHIRQKSREIRRKRKIFHLFPGYKWAAAAAVGMLVCMISINQVYKTKNRNIAPLHIKKRAVSEDPLNEKDDFIRKTGQNGQDTLKLADNYSGYLRTEKQEKRYSENNLKPAYAAMPEKYHKISRDKAVSDNTAGPQKNPRDIDGNGRINIIDAYIMDRRLMSGTSVPEKLDFNGDGNIDHEDINDIVKTAVSLEGGKA